MSWFGTSGGNDEDDKLIATDQQKHPNCSYSREYSRQCSYSSSGGGLVCEQIRKIFRQCPNSNPVIIRSVNSKDEKLSALPSASDSDLGSSGSEEAEMLSKFMKDIQTIEKRIFKSPPFPSKPSEDMASAKPWSIKDFDINATDEAGGKPSGPIERA